MKSAFDMIQFQIGMHSFILNSLPFFGLILFNINIKYYCFKYYFKKHFKINILKYYFFAEWMNKCM